jgi:hypothetical protein
VLDEACAHAQAIAKVSPELDRLIRDRKKVEAAIRRGGGATEEETRAPEEPMPDLATVLQRFGEEIEELLGGRPAARTAETAKVEEDRPSGRQAVGPTLEEQLADLDQRLRDELERQGIVVTGKEVARVVGVAVGKDIEWAG